MKRDTARSIAWCKLQKVELTFFIRLTILHLFYVLPILLADYLYRDDLGRSYSGGTGWVKDGRPLTEQVMLFLGGGQPLSDIAPLPLLLCTVVLAYGLVLYARTNLANVPRNWYLVFGLFSVMGTPFLLGNLSYRFDCLTMVLALTLMLLVYALPAGLPLWQLYLCSTVGGCAALSLYQPVIGMAPGLFLVGLLLFLLGQREEWISLFHRSVGTGVGLAVYLFVVSPLCLESGTWQAESSRIAPFSNFSGKLRDLIPVVANVLTGIPWVYRIAYLLVFCLGWGFAIMALLTKKDKYTLLRVLCGLAIPPAVAVAAVLPLFFLSSSSISSRTLISLCSFTLLTGILMVLAVPKMKQLIAVLLIPCVIFQYSYVYTYGTALTAQNNYNTMLAYDIAKDFETLNADGAQFDSITFIGAPARMQKVTLAFRKYPQFSELMNSYFTNSFWQGGGFLLQYLRGWVNFVEVTDEEYNQVLSMEPAADNHYYACYPVGSKVIITFK